ncbi:protein of unknown function [Candidatus Filomicrobium marinum]|uniref:Uncharacterized protein n=1 Tax=Candidatus Filomicrobium marinum TaxID=1608628 RepID=A0A0D6JEK3_9HYPH|nr:protein of unknown function [Candidatus Filomicrobium marinum]CPR18789.1 protein of unknown function [Candidatus Filomicrobium marinum]
MSAVCPLRLAMARNVGTPAGTVALLSLAITWQLTHQRSAIALPRVISGGLCGASAAKAILAQADASMTPTKIQVAR